MDDYARTDDLTDEEAEQVVRMFAGELRRGWIPKAADIAAAVRVVRAARG
jgi:hypothetical protein